MPTTPDIKAEDYYKAAIRHNEKQTTLMTQPFVKPAGSRSGSECLRQRNCQSLQEVGFEVRQARLKTGAERHIKPVLIPCRYHPDKNPDNKAQAEENFKAGARFSSQGGKQGASALPPSQVITEAYEVLHDHDKRKAYDQLWTWIAPSPRLAQSQSLDHKRRFGKAGVSGGAGGPGGGATRKLCSRPA